ncbi:hypothetical protein FOZ60_012625 [Perkinsus olseni]|uniref:Retrotransposon gag domain-containing protein n=1 Tax=Perkinsus olseni TaxID=32597 RepID=A0A7J6NB38_PEROL|nr:hypothetical protein FOZ60_012625 [Perkinsus olseni]
MSSGSARSPIDVDAATNEATERGQAWGLTDEQMAQLTDMARTAAQQYNELLEEVAASRAASSTAPTTQDTTPARQNDPARPNEVRAATLGLYLEDDYFDSWETLATKEDWASDKEMLLGLFARWQPDEILKAFHGLSWDGRQPFSAFAARLSRYMKDYNRALPDTSKLPKEVMDRQIFDRCVEAAPLAAQSELRKRLPRTIKDICDIVDDYKASAQASKAVAAGLPNDKTGPEKPVPTQAEFEAMMTRSLREIFQPVTEGLGQVLQTVKKQQGQQGQGRPQGLRKCGICEGPHLTHLCTKKKHEKGCFICGKGRTHGWEVSSEGPQGPGETVGRPPGQRPPATGCNISATVSPVIDFSDSYGIDYGGSDSMSSGGRTPGVSGSLRGSEEEMASVGFTISAMVVEELIGCAYRREVSYAVVYYVIGWVGTSVRPAPKSVMDTTHYSPSVVLRPARPVANVVPKATELVSDQDSSLPKRRGRNLDTTANYEEYSTDSSVPSIMSPVVATVAIQTGEDLVAPLGCQPKGHVEFVEDEGVDPDDMKDDDIAGPMRFAVPDFQDEALEMPAFSG